MVKADSSAASRPSASLATAWTLYLVAEARWVEGVQVAPPPVIAPSTALPLPSLTVTSVSLPLAAETLRAPLVATPFVPFFGAMVTTACETLVSALVELPVLLSLPFPDPESESPPPPHAVTASSSTPSSSARIPLLPRARVPTDAPDIGRPFKSVLPSHGLIRPAPQRVAARIALINHTALRDGSPGLSPFSPKFDRVGARWSPLPYDTYVPL